MVYVHHKITIINIRKPSTDELNEELQFFGTSLGLFNLRDKDKSKFRIFLELVKSAKKHQPLTSDQLAETLKLSRGTVVHHLNHLIESGIVLHQGKWYVLRNDNLSDLVEEVKKDILRTCDKLKIIAADLDDRLGL